MDRPAHRTDGIRYPVETPPDFGSVHEVAEGVLWARLPLPMALNHVNVYALDEGDGWTLIDAGIDTPKARGVWETLLAGPLKGKPVRQVLVTHYHPDHIGLAGWFLRDGARLVTTRTSWLLARMLTLDVHDRPVAETQAFWRAAGMPAGEGPAGSPQPRRSRPLRPATPPARASKPAPSSHALAGSGTRAPIS